jgi:hypothetical protein
MALEKTDYPMAIRLLEKGSRNNPQEYIFDYEAGYYAFQNLKDFELAERFFKRAGEKPNAPQLIKRSRAHMVYMQDKLEYAWDLWMDMYRNARTQLEKDASFNHLYQIKFEMDKKLLESVVAQFKERFGRLPAQLDELLEYGLLKAIPVDFAGRPYIYNPDTGKIRARKVYKWKKSLR